MVGNPEPMTRSFPQVVAHRGASFRVAEHTLTAYRRAIELGAEALECDVRLTADGHLVCVHDGRIDRTSDGTGRVSNKTLTQLQEHDFGSWWEGDADVPVAAGGNEILTLDQLIELALSAPRSIHLAIETKHPTRYGGYTEKVLVQTLQRYGLIPADGEESRVRVMSFSSMAMRRIRELSPTLPTVYLMDRLPLLLRSGSLPFGAAIAGPAIELLRRDADATARFLDVGHPVHVWTVDTHEDLQLCMDQSVAAVITNRPGEVVAWRDQIAKK